MAESDHAWLERAYLEALREHERQTHSGEVCLSRRYGAVVALCLALGLDALALGVCEGLRTYRGEMVRRRAEEN